MAQKIKKLDLFYQNYFFYTEFRKYYKWDHYFLSQAL